MCIRDRWYTCSSGSSSLSEGKRATPLRHCPSRRTRALMLVSFFPRWRVKTAALGCANRSVGMGASGYSGRSPGNRVSSICSAG